MKNTEKQQKINNFLYKMEINNEKDDKKQRVYNFRAALHSTLCV